jgi:hypothetical protein
MTLALSASSDGSQTPTAILAEDCDASGGDKEAMVYKAGTFNESALTSARASRSTRPRVWPSEVSTSTSARTWLRRKERRRWLTISTPSPS